MTFDPATPDFAADPFGALRSAAAETPVHRHAGTDPPVTSLFRWEDCQWAARDWGTFSSARPGAAAAEWYELHSLMGTDPPAHGLLRRIGRDLFSRSAVASFGARVAAMCEGVVDRLLGVGPFDVVEDLAAPLGFGALAELMGLPVQDGPQLRTWTAAMAPLFEGTVFIRDQTSLRGPQGTARQAHRALSAHLSRVLDATDPGAATLLAAVKTADLPPAEAVSMACFFVLAGHETTTSLVANLVGLLCDHPDQQRALWEDPALVGACVEETLRLAPSVLMDLRWTTRDVVVRGVAIPARSAVALWWAAANRDPDRFARPDDFDLHRATANHLAFGHGVHFCLGAFLAKAEAEALLTALIHRTDGITSLGEADDGPRQPQILGVRRLRARLEVPPAR